MKIFFKNPWVIVIGGGVIVLIIDSVFFDTVILQSIWGIIKIAPTWFFALKIKVWIVLLIVVMVFWLSSIFWESRISHKKPSETLPDRNRPPWVDKYTSDIFEEVVWRWVWVSDILSNNYIPEKFIAFCPKCDCALVNDSLSGYDCSVCHTKYYMKKNDDSSRRRALIYHKIKNKSYPEKSGS